MNYSVDVYRSNKDNINNFYAIPRKGYHPAYGNKVGESISHWGSDSVRIHAIVKVILLP